MDGEPQKISTFVSLASGTVGRLVLRDELAIHTSSSVRAEACFRALTYLRLWFGRSVIQSLGGQLGVWRSISVGSTGHADVNRS